MNLTVLNVTLVVVSLMLGLLVRSRVYSALVTNKRWLPEKAAKVASLTAIGVIVAGLLTAAMTFFSCAP
ncbi:MAG: hypothetical protein K2Z81_16940 [Cyanobacteria bacterium]|nr:hypothetical protein [Cyanobacteriota bacterium]